MLKQNSFRHLLVCLLYSTKCASPSYHTNVYASGDIEVETVGIGPVPVCSEDGKGIDPGIGRGTSRRGLFNSSIVTPSNFVIPTTGGSPFLTNSYMPRGESEIVMEVAP
jgi:hypothetical protein